MARLSSAVARSRRRWRKMRIKLLVPMAGAEGVWQPGQEADFDDDDAKRFILAGYAVAVEETKIVPETAALEIPEQAIAFKPKRR